MRKLARSIFLLAFPALLLTFASTTPAQAGAQPKAPPLPLKQFWKTGTTWAIASSPWRRIGPRINTCTS